jgi:hypothetical protein
MSMTRTIALGSVATRLGGPLFLSLLGPALSGAATLCVSPAGGACRTAIQVAVDAAGPGDVVRVLPGVYFENVVVPPGKDGLRLLGTTSRTSVIDPDAPNTGAGIRVESSRVEVAALGIRNGALHGVSVAGGAMGAYVHGLRFFGGHGFAAIRAESGSTGLRIVANEIVAAGAVGIELAGANHASVVRANTISECQAGILAEGDGLQIGTNRVTLFATYGIRAGGPGAVVSDNTVGPALSLPTAGLAVTGPDPAVRGNRLTTAGPLRVSCAACTGGVVARNSSTGSFSGYPDPHPGIHVTADAAGLVVSANLASRATGPAFLIEGVGVRATGNVAVDTGTPSGGEGFLVHGGPHSLDHNRAMRCGASGFRVEASDITLDSNVSSGAGVSGFFVFGAAGTHAGNVLVHNQAIDSNAAGFSVTDDALSTVLSGNRGAGNRYDFCDDGAGTDVSGGNQFETTSTVCDVVR